MRHCWGKILFFLVVYTRLFSVPDVTVFSDFYCGEARIKAWPFAPGLKRPSRNRNLGRLHRPILDGIVGAEGDVRADKIYYSSPFQHQEPIVQVQFIFSNSEKKEERKNCSVREYRFPPWRGKRTASCN